MARFTRTIRCRSSRTAIRSGRLSNVRSHSFWARSRAFSTFFLSEISRVTPDIPTILPSPSRKGLALTSVHTLVPSLRFCSISKITGSKTRLPDRCCSRMIWSFPAARRRDSGGSVVVTPAEMNSSGVHPRSFSTDGLTYWKARPRSQDQMTSFAFSVSSL